MAPSPTGPPAVTRVPLPIGDDGDPTPLYTATEYVAEGDSPLYQVVAELIATADGAPDEPAETLVPETKPMGIPLPTGSRRSVPPADAAPTRPAGITIPEFLPHTEPASAPVATASVPVVDVPVTDRPTEPLPVVPAPPARAARKPAAEYRVPQITDTPGGRHQDGWRVAGQRSAADGGRRSAERSPRHRAA